MKTQRLLLFLLCLYFLTATGYAQPDFASPLVQQSIKSQIKMQLRAYWEGWGTDDMLMSMLHDSDIRSALDVSNEQFQQIQEQINKISSELVSTPEFREMMEARMTLVESFDQNNPDEETMNKILELHEGETMLIMTSFSTAVSDNLTPEQKQKYREMQLALMGELPIISPDMFEVLNLTDEQRQEMENIKKELEPEFEKLLEDVANNVLILSTMLRDEQEGLAGDEDKTDDADKKIKENPEFKRIHEEIRSRGQVFATQFKTKMFDVLTDEQWKRLQELIDHPSELAKIILKKLKKERGESEEGESSEGGWQPGPGSWRPGDAIPEQYRQERNTRGNFPRPEN